MNEQKRIEGVYKRYDSDTNWKSRYSIFNTEVLLAVQELERKRLELLNQEGYAEKLNTCKIIDIGGGSGANCLRMIEYGANPENITFNEIYEPRFVAAKKRLPESCEMLLCDACNIPPSYDEQYDIVCINTVFTSILDYEIRAKLARRIWKLTKPGGCVLWYDFKYNNPNNSNVKKVTLKELTSLFPEGEIIARSVTLAPPIARRVIKVPVVGKILYYCLQVGGLRTHIFALIKKAEQYENIVA